MKTETLAAALLGFLPAVLAQDSASLAPSPTQSYGCSPHVDHWHCEGSRTGAVIGATTTLATVMASSPVEETYHDDHHEIKTTASLAPSPTESVGCEPHGDHWHCDGPRTALATEAIVTTQAPGNDEHHHTDQPDVGTLAPSPTESTGCEPHGDHWHCDGPATIIATGVGSVSSSTSSAMNNAATTATGKAVEVTNGAGLQMIPVVGLFAAAVVGL